MDIFNRPHSIVEDTLHFTIYPPTNLSDKASATSLAACITDYADSLLPGFIWHRDKFEVKLVPNADNNGWLFESRMRVGDCVDDEWRTVWLLKQISSKWDVVVSIYDSDGEFLLIEAADALPSWVKPTNSENRVWIYNSRLHLIPLSHTSPPSRKQHRRKLPGAAESDNEDGEAGDDDVFLSAEDAVKIVRDNSIETVAPPAVEEIVWQRISGYPDAAKAHIHVTKAYLPVDISKALVANPSLVQKAVETFYTRDSIQLRAAHRMSRFSPSPSILTSVRMTRTAYAQLVGQKFFPPKIFGHLKEQDSTDEWRWREVGMKIAVGFEMLYQESKGRAANPASSDAANSAAEANKEALQRDPEYHKYIENLLSANYFKGQIQGSQLWNSLENKAAATFVNVRRVDDATRQSFASQVDQALSNKNLPDHSNEPEESEDWLNVDDQEFEAMLEATHSKQKNGPSSDPNAMDVDNQETVEDRLASQQAKQLKDLASKVEDFIEGEGDVEGAIFADEELSDGLLSDDPDSSDSDSDSDSKPNLNYAKSAERQYAMDKLVPGLEASDYGKMPASYHSNSQRLAPESVASDAGESVKAEKSDTETKPDSLPKPRTVRPPIIPRDKYDGVDSDDETDEEEDNDDDESEEDRPQVVGEIEIDMEQEEEEFLEFSRQALGITEEQWSEIVQDRRDRGVFLPSSAIKTPAPKKRPPPANGDPEKKHTPRVPEPGPRPNVNPELDSFEAVMKALDEALAQSRKPSGKSAEKKDEGKAKGKGKENGKEKPDERSAMDVDQDDFDIDAAMEAELKEALEVDEDSDFEHPSDYKMIKNLLESFKNQEGLSGPFSNLAGRLKPDFKLPRDES